MLIELKIGNDAVWLRGGDTAYELCEMRNQAPRAGGEKKPTLVPYKYYSTLLGAITALLEMKVRASDARSLEDLLDTIRQTRKELLLTFDLGDEKRFA
jgi:hypothetical protein